MEVRPARPIGRVAGFKSRMFPVRIRGGLMRKRLKLKKRSCKFCKPFKMSWENRWKPKEEFKLKLAEKEIREAIKNES